MSSIQDAGRQAPDIEQQTLLNAPRSLPLEQLHFGDPAAFHPANPDHPALKIQAVAPAGDSAEAVHDEASNGLVLAFGQLDVDLAAKLIGSGGPGHVIPV